MVTPDTNRLDHPKSQEAKGNDFKCNFVKIMEKSFKGNKNIS